MTSPGCAITVSLGVDGLAVQRYGPEGAIETARETRRRNAVAVGEKRHGQRRVVDDANHQALTVTAAELPRAAGIFAKGFAFDQNGVSSIISIGVLEILPGKLMHEMPVSVARRPLPTIEKKQVGKAFASAVEAGVLHGP